VDDHSALVVAPATTARSEILEFLRSRGYACVLAGTSAEALTPLEQRNFRFTVVDLDLDGADGAGLIRRLKSQRGDPGPIIALSGRPSGRALDRAVMVAADALLQTPLTAGEIDKAIAAVLAPPPRTEAVTPSPTMREELALWQSERMRDLRQVVDEAAAVDVTVLVTGETGAGKDVVARAIHYLSVRRTGPFVKVNCAAVPHDLLESELFGHERGAFTGAHKQKVGKFEAAHQGTIFLDEIGDLHPSLQAKLLHVLQDGDFARVGGQSVVRVDVRVIAATNQDLERAVLERRFREDLYYRLNVIQLSVPPLRERVEEIPAFIEYFVQRYSKMFGRHGFVIPPDVRERLLGHEYRGNVRELENIIKRMIVLGDPTMVRAGLPRSAGGPGVPVAPFAATPGAGADLRELSLKDVVRRASLTAERDTIRQVLNQTGWNRVRAAKALRISYRALLYKMKRGGLRDEAAAYRPAGLGTADRVGGLSL
jgi:two-component system response regulator AtoC